MGLMKTAVLAVFTLTAATPAFGQEVTLRFQHFVSPNTANPKYFIEPWAEKVEADSDGRIEVEIYPFMQLGGKPQAQYDLVRDGAIDGGWVITGYQPGRFPETDVLELPFMTPKSAEEASKAAWAFTERYLMDDFADVHVIAAHLHGTGIIHKKGPKPQTIEDLEGLRLRSPSRPVNLLLDKLGAVPVGMPSPAFTEALAKGVVDGGVIPWEIGPSLKLDELTDSHTDVAGDRSPYNLFFIWAMNKDKYDSLPEDLKKVIDDNSGMMASAWAGRAHDRGDREGREVMVSAGNEIATLDDEETAKMRTMGDEVIADWIAEADKKGLDGQALVDDARAIIESYEGTATPPE
ncbi:TRAP transporter substrate-binding protein [Qingshengfaniella alkalisoli]|uniref:TRAP transporter substrate-binding protein n=1 Tax=Qingshengfaniella alkalisoli TaxID=2599296 RepID=A0A5B8IWK1_9RHOB|nr:TRAP transporter substrate-binding protein [Qingshengfaniella alkalisoli]QDY69913.1 TRAP transporter substrate-binding protein [Qingshengfaniella alkalisoli]